jgi:hypothetical protein
VSEKNPRFVPEQLCPPDAAGSLVESLGSIADMARDIADDLGANPYRVFSIVTSWSGGKEGRGEESVISEREFSPRPTIDLRPLRVRSIEGGSTEKGLVKMTKISPRMTEKEILAFFPRELKQNEFAFIEVRHDERDGQTARRRFQIRGTPWRDAKKFEWQCMLADQEAPRTEAGQLNAPQEFPPRYRG